MLNYFTLPDAFPSGSDVDKIARLPGGQFYKRFKREKFGNFCKTVYILRLVKGTPGFPVLIRSTPALELYTTDCGNMPRIWALPTDWAVQLLRICEVCTRNGILIKDWGLWELYPFLLNNLTLKEGQLSFVDLGDAVSCSDARVIRAYFDKKIRAINYIRTYGYGYLFFHYPRRIAIMFWRKIKQYGLALVLLYLLFHLFGFIYPRHEEDWV